MKEGSGTRSSLLWEVKRLLLETKNKPQVLVMENVPMVHADKNLKDFSAWIAFLGTLGYQSFYEDINAKDYIAQSRNRCFCVSVLGNYTYHFPSGHHNDTVILDYLEDEVDERYYLKSDKAWNLIDKLVKEGKIPTNKQTNKQTNSQSSCQLSASQSTEQMQFSQERTEAFQESEDKAQELLSLGHMTDSPHESTEVFNSEGISRCLQATEYKHPERIMICKPL